MLYFVMDLEQNIKNQSNFVNKRPFIEWSFVFYINLKLQYEIEQYLNPLFY